LSSLERLMEELRRALGSGPAMSAPRILVLTALYLSQRLTFSELVRVTGLSKGSLEHHVAVLEREGLVKRVRRPTLAGPRLFIEITAEGRRVLERVIEVLSRVLRERETDSQSH